MNFKLFSIISSSVLLIIIGGYGLYQWFSAGVYRLSTVVFLFLCLGFLFQSLTWGDINGKDESKKNKDEKYITLLSFKISYFILLILMVVVLIISEGFVAMDDIQNIPLVIVLGLAWIILPITEFIVAKKLRNTP